MVVDVDLTRNSLSLLFPGRAFIWSLFARYFTRERWCLLTFSPFIPFSTHSCQQKEENSYASGVKLRSGEENTTSSGFSFFAVIDFQVGSLRPLQKPNIAYKKGFRISSKYIWLQRSKSNTEQLTPLRPPFCFSALSQNARVFLAHVFWRETVELWVKNK